MFKIGDKVKRTYGNSGGMSVGDIGTVKEIIDNEWMILEEYGERHLITRFELFKSREWKTEEERIDFLNDEMIRISGESPEEKIKLLKKDLEDYKNDIDRQKRYLNTLWKSYRKTMQDLELLKTAKSKSFEDDLKALINHKYVTNVITKSNDLVVTTDYIDIYDEEDNKFKGNKYELIFNFKEMNCYIIGLDADYCRESYWTEKDPHPHVNAETGEACWGTAGSMLTDNMNNYEIYASFIVVLNFLQQVNTDDSAGKYIRNWDCIDEEGNDLENPHEKEYTRCTICDCEMETEEAYYCEDCQEHVCEDHIFYIDYGDKYVCEGCHDSSYVACEHCGDKMHESDEDREVVDDLTYCSDCFGLKYGRCYDCDEVINKEDIFVLDGDSFCQDCYNDYFTTCEECQNQVREEDTFYCNHCSSTYCEDCMDEPIPGMCQTCYDEKEEEETEEVEAV